MTQQPDESAATDVSTLTYEQARDELVETVARLESGHADLESSVALWERGEALAAHCMAALDRAEARLDRSGHGSGEDTAGDSAAQGEDDDTVDD